MKPLVYLGLLGIAVNALIGPIAAGEPDQPTATNFVKIPIEFHRGHIMLRARANDADPLLFMLDSGFAITMISPEQAAALSLKRVGKISIVGVAGEEPAETFEGLTIDLGGGLKYTPRRVASLASHSRRYLRRDGVLGAGFYRQFVLEFDHADKSLILHAPKTFEYSGSGEIIPLTFRKSTPVVRASILFSNLPPVTGEFEIDTGCDGGLCLGHDFVQQNGLEEKVGTGNRSAREGVGGGTRTRVVRLPQLQLGKVVVQHPTANFFEQGSPADDGLAGHIGMEVLRQFRIIFDYSHKRMIFEPYEPQAKPPQ
jgi:hypothetical protein